MNLVSASHDEGRLIVRLSGDIDVAEVDRVSSAILGAVKDDTRDVVVDFSEVTYLDSSGIQMLFDLVRRFHSARQAVAVTVPEASPLSTLLKITHVHEACPVAGTVEECLEALSRDSKLY